MRIGAPVVDLVGVVATIARSAPPSAADACPAGSAWPGRSVGAPFVTSAKTGSLDAGTANDAPRVRPRRARTPPSRRRRASPPVRPVSSLSSRRSVWSSSRFLQCRDCAPVRATVTEAGCRRNRAIPARGVGISAPAASWPPVPVGDLLDTQASRDGLGPRQRGLHRSPQPTVASWQSGRHRRPTTIRRLCGPCRSRGEPRPWAFEVRHRPPNLGWAASLSASSTGGSPHGFLGTVARVAHPCWDQAITKFFGVEYHLTGQVAYDRLASSN